MPIFADVSDTVWLALIGVLAMAVKEYFDHKRAAIVAAKVEAAAAVVAAKVEAEAVAVASKVEAVKVAAILAAEKVETKLELATAVQAAKIEDVAAKVEVVHKATNSLTEKLVATTEAEALARGGVEERTRADERAKAEGK